MSRHPDVTVVGSINQDMVARVPRLPGAGQTVLGHELLIVPGGKGLNQAVAAARSGASTAFVGMVGQDGAGTHLLGVLSDEGIDTHGVLRVGALTGRALIAVADDGENHIVVVPGANWVVSPAHIDHHRVRIDSARVVLAAAGDPHGCRRGGVAAGQGGRCPDHPQRHATGRAAVGADPVDRLPGRERARGGGDGRHGGVDPGRRRGGGCRAAGAGLWRGHRDAGIRGRGPRERGRRRCTSPPSRSRRSTPPRPAMRSRAGSPLAWPRAPAWPTRSVGPWPRARWPSRRWARRRRSPCEPTSNACWAARPDPRCRPRAGPPPGHGVSGAA